MRLGVGRVGMVREEKVLLVGDNPFHGISHLSQERSRVRAVSYTHLTLPTN